MLKSRAIIHNLPLCHNRPRQRRGERKDGRERTARGVRPISFTYAARPRGSLHATNVGAASVRRFYCIGAWKPLPLCSNNPANAARKRSEEERQRLAFAQSHSLTPQGRGDLCMQRMWEPPPCGESVRCTLICFVAKEINIEHRMPKYMRKTSAWVFSRLRTAEPLNR